MIWTGILTGAAALFGLVAWLSRRRPMMACVYLTMASACLAVALFEGYRGTQAASTVGVIRFEGTITGNFIRPDDALGFLPNENARVTARKFYRDSLLYDAVYTIDANGLRVSPPHNPGNEAGCVIFFGDSLTFGEGVNDDENFPYLVGLKTGGKYRIYNFAFIGYGPHQMLANLASSRVVERIQCTPSHVIFLCFAGHIERVAGLSAWDRHGPRFRLAEDGSAQRDGNFDDPKQLGTWMVPKWAAQGLERSWTWQKLFGGERRTTSRDLDLLIAIMTSSKEATVRQFPSAQFHVILWDGLDSDRAGAIRNRLISAGLSVHLLTSVIPNIRENWKDYVISPYDLHPNTKQHERLAAYIVSEVLKANASR